MQEDEEAAEQRAAAEASHDEVGLLASAGIRQELAVAVADGREHDESSADEDEQEGRSDLLAWAVLLAHILGLEPGSSQRARVCQAVHDTHR